jgi:hypothetical protein
MEIRKAERTFVLMEGRKGVSERMFARNEGRKGVF